MNAALLTAGMIDVSVLAVGLTAAVRVFLGHERGRGTKWEMRLSTGVTDIASHDEQRKAA